MMKILLTLLNLPRPELVELWEEAGEYGGGVVFQAESKCHVKGRREGQG